MRPRSEYISVMSLVEAGLNNSEISRKTRIPLATIREWRIQGEPGGRPTKRLRTPCPICEQTPLDEAAYSYLLGMYLGDGCISETHRGVERLRIAIDEKHQNIIDECTAAMAKVKMRTRIGHNKEPGCIVVGSYWKHWSCLFPQHGRGPKHLRVIELQGWQAQFVTSHPKEFLRGLIHSDGCRFTNRVRRTWRFGATTTYEYPRYMFTNNSDDIRGLFCWACDMLGIAWRRTNWRTVGVSRRESVALLDEFVGPKS